MLRKARISLGCTILAISILFLAWGYWPAHRELRVRPVSSSVESSPAEQRALTLLFPPKIRAGEPAVVRLTLDVDAVRERPSISMGAGSTNVFDSHQVIAEARFDIPGMPVRPSGLISAPVSPGQTAVFYWTLRPGNVGKFRGTIWLYVRLVDKQTGEESRATVSAQIVEIESVRLLGLSANQARVTGLVAFVSALVLILPFLGAVSKLFLVKRSNIL